MNSSLRWIAVTVCCGMLVSGCKKKESAASEGARETGSKLPGQERVAPVAETTPGSAPAAPDGSATPVVATAAGGKTDQAAYEAWFKKYGLDLKDPKMLDADPDGDGFTNREEFLADTDPHDPKSHPGIHKGIRLKEYNEVRLPLILEAIEGDKARLRRTDQPEAKPIMVKAGDTIRGLPLKVTQVEEKEDYDKSGERVNMSHVSLEDSANKEKYTLMKDLPARTSETYAVLTSPDGKTTMKVHRGEVFSWPAEEGSRYKVIDLSKDQVVLLEVDHHKTWTIPRM